MSSVLAEKPSGDKSVKFAEHKPANIRELLKIPSELRTFQHCKDIIHHVKVNISGRAF